MNRAGRIASSLFFSTLSGCPYDATAGAQCTKNEGDASTSTSCEIYNGTLALWLEPDDSAYLGGFDFDLTVTCNGAVVQQSHEVFETTRCAC